MIFPEDQGMKSYLSTLTPKIYDLLSDKVKKLVSYSPEKRYVSEEDINIKKVWEHFYNIAQSLNLEPFDELEEFAKSILNFAFNKEKQASITKKLSNKNPFHFAIVLIYISAYLNPKFDYISQRELCTKIRNDKSLKKSINESYLRNFVDEFIKYIPEKVEFLPFYLLTRDQFKKELNKLIEKYKKEGKRSNYILCKIILNLFISVKSTPQIFAKTLNILKLTPSELLNSLKRENLLVQFNVLARILQNIRKFVRKNLDKKKRISVREYISEFIKIKKEFFDNINLRQLEAFRERNKLYGTNYKSTEFRIKIFILMLGFSPYDGYDMWKSKSYDKKLKRIRIWANLHHIDDDLKKEDSDDEKNLVFIPMKHPTDSKQDTRYLTHAKLSSYQANKFKTLLKSIKKTTIHNANILKRAFLTNNLKLLDSLRGWSKESILNAKKRLKDESCKWTKDLEKYIPLERTSRKRLSSQEKELIIKNLLMKRKKMLKKSESS